MPAIVSGGLMAFTLSMDEFVVTDFTFGPDSVTLPLRIFGRIEKGLDPSLNAISALFIVAVTVMVLFPNVCAGAGRAIAKGEVAEQGALDLGRVCNLDVRR